MRIVHLGLGGFHRAHQAVYTADANALRASAGSGAGSGAGLGAGAGAGSDGQPWTITGVGFRNRGLVDALRRQNHRYAIVEMGPDAAPPRAMTVIDETLLVADEAQSVIDRIAHPATGAVTLTVTENAYPFDAAGTGLDVTDGGVRHDLELMRTAGASGAGQGGGFVGADTRPQTMLGLLASGLLARARRTGDPLAVITCDNLSHNGPRLRALLEQFAGELGGAAGRQLTDYLSTVHTPGTMVDRIVPATNQRARELAAAAGIPDDTALPTEAFSMWVIEHDSADGTTAPEPLAGWFAAGAIATPDVAAYELVKLRLLNAVNSTLAHFGLLAGHRHIHDALADPACRAIAEGVSEQMAATVTPPPGLDLDAYRAQVFSRFSNADLAHTCRQVASTGSAKLTERLPGALTWHADHGDAAPEYLAQLTAAWLVGTAYPELIIAAGQLTGPGELPTESVRERVQALGGSGPESVRGGGGARLAHQVLTEAAILGPVIAQSGSFVQRVGECVEEVTVRHQTCR